MKDKELRAEFNRLVTVLKDREILEEGSYICTTSKMNSIMGIYGHSILDKFEELSRRLYKQDEKINMISEHFRLEFHTPDCKEILRKKTKD